ncbi:MAG: hypothetical protein ACXACU_19580, partial [Candidatus Hodarchaeales archaeon]
SKRILTSNNRKLAMERIDFLKFVILAIGLSILIFSVLIFLTGGINNYFFLQVGLFLEERSLVWNVTNHLRIQIPYNPGVSLLVVAIFSGVIYSGLISTRKYCVISDEEGLKKPTAVSSASSVIAGSSALASGVVCCSTSIISLISPAFSAIVAPISPFLIVFSFILLNFTLFYYVIPRFPNEPDNEINIHIT